MNKLKLISTSEIQIARNSGYTVHQSEEGYYLDIRECIDKLVFAMRTYGGSFSRHIAEALVVADVENEAKLLECFRELFVKYLKF